MKGTHPCADHGLASAAALTLASVPAVALAVPQDEASQNEASPITLDLYNLTDVHGHIQQVAKKGVVREAGLPAMNCYLKKARATYTVGSVTFLLAGGDSFEALTRGGAATTNGNLDRDSFNAYLGAHSGAAARPEPLGRCCGWFPVWQPGRGSDAAQEREGSQELPGPHGCGRGGPGRSAVCRSDRWCWAGRPSPRQSLPKREQVALDRRGGGARHSDQT